MPTFQVLYTKQKQKKRKAWQDGRIEVDFFTGSCLLYSDGTKTTFCASLDDPLLLTSKHMDQIKSGLELELDFANYVATIEYTTVQAAKAEAPPAKAPLPKFKPHAKLSARLMNAEQEPEAPQHHQPRHVPLSSNQGRLASGRGRYDVSNDELDEEWGCDERDPAANGGSAADDEEDEEQQEGHNYSPGSWGGAPRGLHAHSHSPEVPPANYQLEPSQEADQRHDGFDAWGQGQGGQGQQGQQDQSRGLENESNGRNMLPGLGAGMSAGSAPPNDKAALWSMDWLAPSGGNQSKTQEPQLPAPALLPAPAPSPAKVHFRTPPTSQTEAPVPADDSVWGFF